MYRVINVVPRKRVPKRVSCVMVKTANGRLTVSRPGQSLIDSWNKLDDKTRRKEVRNFFGRFINGEYTLSEPAYQKICCAFGIKGE